MKIRETITDYISRLTPKERIFWAQDNGFFVRNMDCSYCVRSMELLNSKKACDGYWWRCMNSECSKYQTTKSVRSGGCFENFSMDIVTLIKVIVLWSNGVQQYKILKLLPVSRSFLHKFENFMCNKIERYFEINPVFLGGVNRTCQIDETMINFKVKSHVGRGPREKIWVFGIVDTSYSPALGYVEVVPNRTSATLFPIIQRVIRPGTVIISDEWPAYGNIENDLGFSHFKVCHKENFVTPETLLHTQNVESYWNRLKLVLKIFKGVLPGKHLSFLNLFMWRERCVGCEIDKGFELVKL